MPAHTDETPLPNLNLIEYAATIVEAYIGKNRLSAAELPAFIKETHATLAGLAQPGGEFSVTTQKPAVSAKRSITPDYIICLEDGKKLKMLKRYLRSRYGLTPEQYRTKWGLPHDYPMTAPNYAATRSTLAKKSGLGRRPGAAKKRRRG
jgi:predicted transcriptional regulator